MDVKKIEEANDDMQRAMPELLRGVMLTAQITRAKYLSLIEVGFTEKQAIELCRGSL